MISMSPRPFRKIKSYTAISVAWDGLCNWGKTQTRGKKKSASQAKRYSPGREKGTSSPRDFYVVSLPFSPFFPTAEPGFRVRSARKQFFCSQKSLWNVDASSN